LVNRATAGTAPVGATAVSTIAIPIAIGRVVGKGAWSVVIGWTIRVKAAASSLYSGRLVHRKISKQLSVSSYFHGLLLKEAINGNEVDAEKETNHSNLRQTKPQNKRCGVAPQDRVCWSETLKLVRSNYSTVWSRTNKRKQTLRESYPDCLHALMKVIIVSGKDSNDPDGSSRSWYLFRNF
jgi:hypothetical protein